MTRRVALDQAWSEDNIDCFACSIRSSALFNGLTEQDFEQMHEPVEQINMQPGEVIYKVGDFGRHLFTVRSGLIKLVQYLPDGTPRIVRLMRSTDVFGLELLVGERYEHEAVVLRAAGMCRYPKEAVSRLSQTNPVLHKDLMIRWQKSVTDADVWLTQLSTGSAKKRMASLLLLLKEENSTECFLFSREDIGSILSITIETASRTISDFKRNGLMTEIKHNHYVLDVPALKDIIVS